MSDDREFEEIRRLFREAYRAGLYKKSAEISSRGAELAGAAGNVRWRVYFLFWYGDSLRLVGEREAAQLPLLEAARLDPEADPEYQFQALTTLISIALSHREARYCCRLITQGRDYLGGVRKESWRHMLDKLDGDLALARGEFELAKRCYEQAWDYASRPSIGGPGYTAASHVADLVTTAFALRDVTALLQWQSELEGCKKGIEADRIEEETGHLLLLRARHGDEGLATAVPSALGLLRRVQAMECTQHRSGPHRVALRILILAAYWAALDDWLVRIWWDPAGFRDQIFRADERLAEPAIALDCRYGTTSGTKVWKTYVHLLLGASRSRAATRP